MYSSIFSLFLLASFSLLPYSIAVPPHRPPSNPLSSSLRDLHAPPKPTEFFEVTKPINHPKTTPCSHLVLQHDFGYSYGRPPVVAAYAPPSHCPATFSTAVLEWSATCQGRQFDRIFGVWLGGVELLRSCTAEPTKNGIFWKVQTDITRYSSLLKTNQTLAVYLGNLIDKTYTGIYHVNITIHYYPVEESGKKGVKLGTLGSGYKDWADLIIPISRNLPLNDGLWFEIQSSGDLQSKTVVIPKNVCRAVLEVYVSYHENDEFWDTNLPNDYLIANNLSKSLPGNGPFREVLVSIDGDLVGAVWPFTVVFTGGINPLLWRPISAIGSFNLPSYDIEITPFLGRLLDGQAHSFGFRVTNALNVWYIDGNLHLWLDDNAKETKAHLFEHKAEPLTLASRSDFTGLDGVFFTGASRSIVSNGWVSSSYGNITTFSIQNFDFKNFMALRNNGDKQIVNQNIEFNTSVLADSPSSSLPFYSSESYKNFPMFLYTNQVDQGNNSYSLFSNVTLGFNEDKILAVGKESSSSSLRNEQNAQGTMVVKGNLVASGWGSNHQVYEYDEGNGEFCYSRNVSSFNYTILSDEVRDTCKSNDQKYVPDLGGPSSFRQLVYLLIGAKEKSDAIDVGWEYGLVKASGAIRPDGWAYRFLRTNTTVLFYWSACLCDLQKINESDPKSEVAMHLDRPPSFLTRCLDRFDVVVFNTGRHWNGGKLDANHWVIHIGGVPNQTRIL